MYIPCRFDTILRVPDPYFLSSGVSSSPIGYTDGYGHVTDIWQHLNIGRMYGYDGTFYKSVTQGWMGQHCPPAPMEDHLAEIDLTMAQYLGQGITSCNNCDRVFDGADSKALLSFWLAWFRRHRSLLTTDVIHLLRPNGRDIDATVHVDRNASARYRAVGLWRMGGGHLLPPLRASSLAARSRARRRTRWMDGCMDGWPRVSAPDSRQQRSPSDPAASTCPH